MTEKEQREEHQICPALYSQLGPDWYWILGADADINIREQKNSDISILADNVTCAEYIYKNTQMSLSNTQRYVTEVWYFTV